jgi:hypothetical protein
MLTLLRNGAVIFEIKDVPTDRTSKAAAVVSWLRHGALTARVLLATHFAADI